MGFTSVKCPECGTMTDQSPCWKCGYQFPLAVKEELAVEKLRA